MLAPLRDPIELDLYAGRLAEETGVGKESVMASAKRAVAGVNRQRRREQLKAQQQVAAARTVGNPERQWHMRAGPWPGRRYLGPYPFCAHQGEGRGSLEERLPPEKLRHPVEPQSIRSFAGQD